MTQYSHALTLYCWYISRLCSSLHSSQEPMSHSPTQPIVSWGMQPFMAVLAPSLSCSSTSVATTLTRGVGFDYFIFISCTPSCYSPSSVGVVRQQPSIDLPRQLLSLFLDDSYAIRHLPCLCLRAGRHLMCPSPKCNCHLVHLCLNVDGCLLDMLSEVLCHSPRLLPCGPS